MNKWSDPRCPDYRHGWHCDFSIRGKRAGAHAARAARNMVSMWRAMRRRAAAGGNPSTRNYRRDPDPYRFLMKRQRAKIDKALRLGLATRVMERRGLFDALRHHQTFRGFGKAMKRPRRR